MKQINITKMKQINITKMKQINIKYNYNLPHFIQFKKNFLYRSSPVTASGHLHY